MKTCAKCNRMIAKNDLVHWPEGKEQHVDCQAALDASIMSYVPTFLQSGVKYLGTAVDETWNG